MYLEIKDLAKSYNHNNPIIKKLDFSVKKGEIISFLGESGSGKTTFLKCISGLEAIDSGTIKLNGITLNSDNVYVKPQKRKIGFVFQDYPLFPHLTLRENITFNLNKQHADNLEYMINLSGLEKLLDRYPHELSGGEQQRGCIARALIRKPDLLLLDEPFSNLDSNIKFSMREEIYKIVKETKTTTILVTHDINDSMNIADRILIFKAGVLQQFDNPHSMYCEPVNCYCAKILGDLNQIEINNKTFYIRPEKLKIVKKSDVSVIVEKCFFQGKEYKIQGKYKDNQWHLFSQKPVELQSKIAVEFEKNDLIYFDSFCKNYFK